MRGTVGGERIELEEVRIIYHLEQSAAVDGTTRRNCVVPVIAVPQAYTPLHTVARANEGVEGVA